MPPVLQQMREEADRQAGVYRLPLPSRERRRKFWRDIPERYVRMQEGVAIGLITEGERERISELSNRFYFRFIKDFYA